MRFKLLYGCIIILSVVLSGCDESGEGTANVSTINTVEELNEFVSGINFEIDLSSDKSFSFIPSRDFNLLDGTNFSSMEEGFDYSGNTFRVTNNGSAELTIYFSSTISITFDYAICTSVESIGRNYPDIAINPEFNNYLVYIATTSSKYSNKDLITGEPIFSEPYIQVIINPFDGNSFSGFFAINSQIYSMSGSFKLSNKGMTSTGITGTSGGVRIFDYDLKFNCGN